MRLPHSRQGLTLPSGSIAPPWYAWFRRIEELADSGAVSGDSATAAIATLCRALGSPDGTPETITAQLTLTGRYSVQVDHGIVSLQGDQPTPGPVRYYGTDVDGIKGWQAVSDALLPGAAVTLAVGADGRTTISADGAVPTFLADGATYTVAANKQALFALPIELDGTGALVIDGALVEVA